MSDDVINEEMYETEDELVEEEYTIKFMSMEDIDKIAMFIDNNFSKDADASNQYKNYRNLISFLMSNNHCVIIFMILVC